MAEKNHYIALYICTAIILIVLVTGGIAIQKPKEVAPASTLNLDLDASPTAIPPTTESDESEPVPFGWEEYSNDKYNFAFSYPEKWYKQEYAEGTFISFSPDPLPCEDCTYLHDGYFSIKIYSQKTDPEAYVGFLQKMKALGRAQELRPARLGGQQGFLFGNTVAAQNEGWVYELTLEKNKGKGTIDNAQIFKHILSSFKFTNLVFTN